MSVDFTTTNNSMLEEFERRKRQRKLEDLNVMDAIFVEIFMTLARYVDPSNEQTAPYVDQFAGALGMTAAEYQTWYNLNDGQGWTSWSDNTDFDRIDYTSLRDTVNNPPDGLLSFIADHESNGDYDAYYNYHNRAPVDLTSMTINEVLAWQRQYVNSGSASSAAGRYQIIRGTLESLVDDMGLTGEERFDEAMQDRMAIALLERRGLDDFLEGDISEARFMRNLSQEWASLPKDMGGASYYAGDGLNQALTSPQSVLVALRDMQTVYSQRLRAGASRDEAMVASVTSAAEETDGPGIDGGSSQTAFAAASVAHGGASADEPARDGTQHRPTGPAMA